MQVGKYVGQATQNILLVINTRALQRQVGRYLRCVSIIFSFPPRCCPVSSVCASPSTYSPCTSLALSFFHCTVQVQGFLIQVYRFNHRPNRSMSLYVPIPIPTSTGNNFIFLPLLPSCFSCIFCLQVLTKLDNFRPHCKYSYFNKRTSNRRLLSLSLFYIYYLYKVFAPINRQVRQ